MITADALNEHLRGGGIVQITTYYRSTVYEQRHAGMFVEKPDGLYVKRGKGLDYLGHNKHWLVGIRCYHYAR